MYKIPASAGNLANCAATENGRHSLATVYLDPAGVAVVTDGHRLVVMPIEADAGAVPIMIGSTFWRALYSCIASAERRCKIVVDAIEPQTVRMSCGDFSLTVPRQEGTFPDWRKILPGSVEHAVLLDPALLQEILTAVPSAQGRLIFGLRGPHDPVCICDIDGDGLAMLMPCIPYEPTDWATVWSTVCGALGEKPKGALLT